jgi:hypothetical protein
MGLFKKKEEKIEEVSSFPDIPKLPELPEFANVEENPDERVSQLPSFPQGSLGNRFSQYSIKNAVTGKREEEADEFIDEEQEIQEPSIRKVRDYETEVSTSRIKNEEPRFIRIDKFEESSKAFEEIKKQAGEIEKMFGDLKKVKEEEEKEMGIFESEIKKIKEKIENIDKNIFFDVV